MLVRAFTRMIADLTLPGGHISFWRAQVALEREYRNDVEVHLDYMVTGAGYWPDWAERPTFQSKIVQSWIESRADGPIPSEWIDQQAKATGQPLTPSERSIQN